jgi:hypothetical protein
VQHKVEFEFDSKEEERAYKDACALLRGAAQKSLQALNVSRRDGDFTSITSKVHKGKLLVFIHQGMIG